MTSLIGNEQKTVFDTWLQNRQKLLNRYWQVLALPPFDSNQPPHIERCMKLFLQALMDYSAECHFKIYDLILNHNSSMPDDKTYECIYKTTALFVALNDKFDETDTFQFNDEIKDQLSNLGEQLSIRFDIEDKLLLNYEKQMLAN